METHAKGQKGVWSNDTLTNNEQVESETLSQSEVKDKDSGHESEEASNSESEESSPDKVAVKKISDFEVIYFIIYHH